MKEEYTWIKDISPGKAFITIAKLQAKERKISKANDPYLRLVLCDKTGNIDSVVWSRDIEKFERECKLSDAFLIEGVGIAYQGKKGININNIRKVEDESLARERLEILSPHDVGVILSRLKDLADLLNNPYLKKLLLSFLEDRSFIHRYISTPAGKEIHHAYAGGLLEHTVSLMELCIKLQEHYNWLSLDLLLVGAFLHDIGKIEELDLQLEGVYTDEGRLVGHIVLGAMIADKKMKKIKGFPKRLRTLVLHMILSHQGLYEFGSPKRPKFAEALALYYLDELDTKLFQVKQFGRQGMGSPDSNWAGYNRLLGRFILKDAPNFLNESMKEETMTHGSYDLQEEHPRDLKKRTFSIFDQLLG